MILKNGGKTHITKEGALSHTTSESSDYCRSDRKRQTDNA